ncbi:MAG: phosphate acyltransferase PlsX [Dehalococcoidia bacterium]|nr:phosphate acyltransferase PlsX [Dehalococcoidia bacterium]
MTVRIALDAMGGDYAPLEVVKGAVDALREFDLEVVLVGQEERICEFLPRGEVRGLYVQDAREVITMGESPAMAVRAKKDSSLVVGMGLVKQGNCQAFLSAGNTGAVMASALFVLGRIRRVERPAIGGVFPTLQGRSMVIDMGANVDCRPVHLVQFAHMGSVYMEKVFGMPNPRVGLLSNGEEKSKGNQVTLQTHGLLEKSGLNFIGNIEGKDILRGVAEVVVTDGFVGNIVVKLGEGLSETLFSLMRKVMTSKPHFGIAAMVLEPAFQQVARYLDYTEHGGAPLLGVRGVVVITHGRCNAKAVKNALGLARNAVEQDIVGAIASGLGSPSDSEAERDAIPG